MRAAASAPEELIGAAAAKAGVRGLFSHAGGAVAACARAAGKVVAARRRALWAAAAQPSRR